MARVTLDTPKGVRPGTIVAVDDIDLEIEDGEFVTVVGPSGCGKTTTLRMVAGLEEPTSGAVRFDDEDVTEVHAKERPVAMVFQNYALYPHKTVLENMAFGLKMSTDMTAEQRRERVTEMAEMMGIEDLLDDKPDELSGGQKQRVALGRAIAREPEVFLFVRRAALEPRRQAPHTRCARRFRRRSSASPRCTLPMTRRGDDDGRPPRHLERRREAPAGREAHRGVREPGQQVRRRLHWFAVDELHRRGCRDRRLVGDDPRRRVRGLARSSSATSTSRVTSWRTPLHARNPAREHSDRGESDRRRDAHLDRRGRRADRLRQLRPPHDQRDFLARSTPDVLPRPATRWAWCSRKRTFTCSTRRPAKTCS